LPIEGMTPYMLPVWGFTALPKMGSWPGRWTKARTVLTADPDYPRLLAVARASEPSLILFRNGNWSEAEVRTRLGEILATLTEADIARSIIVVDRNRVRRRRLPIGK
jgi:hypothetical protein